MLFNEVKEMKTECNLIKAKMQILGESLVHMMNGNRNTILAETHADISNAYCTAYIHLEELKKILEGLENGTR